MFLPKVDTAKLPILLPGIIIPTLKPLKIFYPLNRAPDRA